MAKIRSLQSALDAPAIKQLPEVDSYYDKIYQRTYAARWGGFVSGFLMAGLVGAAIGVMASFLPLALGVTGAAWPAPEVIATSAAFFASVGSTIGTAICTMVGSSAGAVAAGLEEFERRQKLEKIREQNPEQAAEIEKAAESKAEAIRPASSIGQWMQLAKRSFNWPVTAMGTLIGAATGAMFNYGAVIFPANGAFVKTGITFLMGAAATPTQILLASMIVGGLIGGAYFGLRGSLVSNSLANAFAPALTGKIFEGKLLEIPQPSLSAPAVEEPSAEVSTRSYRAVVTASRAEQENTTASIAFH